MSKQHPILIASDHAGYELKQEILSYLTGQNAEVIDLGTNSSESTDYPDYAHSLCEKITNNEASIGILICHSGIGMSIVANRHPNIRAAVVANAEQAALTRSHNNANVLCLGAHQMESATAQEIVNTFIDTNFDQGERHLRRISKINSENSYLSEDPELATAISQEIDRQQNNIELIASENFASSNIRSIQGSHLTNKYAEGYPGKRWYGGCENVDLAEALAIERAKELFGSEHANVQPHSGSQANAAVYFSALEYGDKILAMDLSHGGHLTHGHPANFSGKFYEVSSYGVDEETDYCRCFSLPKNNRLRKNV